MKQSLSFLAVLCLIVAGTGCASLDVLEPKPDVSKFYFLDHSAILKEVFGFGGDSVLLEFSSMAKYLDQRPITLVSGPNQLHFADLHRWGEPLEASVNHIVLSCIARELNTSHIAFKNLSRGEEWDHRIGYHIYKLGGTLDGPVELEVSWWHTGKDGERHFKRSSYEADVANAASDDLTGYVQAIQSVVIAWAVELSAELANHSCGPDLSCPQQGD